jgi:exopolysaccharide biosynthesis protein
MAYSKAKLKSNGVRASPCFKPFLIGNYKNINNQLDSTIPVY